MIGGGSAAAVAIGASIPHRSAGRSSDPLNRRRRVPGIRLARHDYAAVALDGACGISCRRGGEGER
jgi:hypothetical protein